MTLTPAQRLAVAAGLVLLLTGMGFGLHHALRPQHPTARATPAASAPAARPRPARPEYFKGRDPDLVLMISGQMYGYLQPCGCARPQLGGLERRFELLRQLRGRGWPVSAADLGDLAPKGATAQDRLKFETALQALQKLNYAAVGLGVTEAGLTLEQTLSIGLNYQPPTFLAANLLDKEGRFPEMYRPWVVHAPTPDGPKVGYVGVVADETAGELRKLDPSATFGPAADAVAQALDQVQAQKPAVLVLLFHGPRAAARPLAQRFPQFHVVVTLDESDEPSAVAEKAGAALLISVGHKSKYVGLVGVFGGTAGAPELKYELAALSEAYELPDDQTNPAREQLREYVRAVYRGDYLGKWPRASHPHQLDLPAAKFVGAEACKDCHKAAYAVWKDSRHAHAWESLEQRGRPLAQVQRKDQPPLTVGRQYDPECARCHVTGFDYKTGFVTAAATPHLKGNQCENCHGPASLHVAEPREAKYLAPLRQSLQRADAECRKCHDGDNDPKFKLEEYWPKIRHGKN